MGAFWDAWNKQGEANDKSSMMALNQLGVMSEIQDKATARQRQITLREVMSSNAPMEAKMQSLAQLGPEGMQVASQMGALQGAMNKQREDERLRVLRPQLQEMFSKPAVAPEMGPPEPGMTLNPGSPASFDRTGYVQRAATEGLIAPEAAMNHMGQEQVRRDALAQNATLARERAAALAQENNNKRDQRTWETEQKGQDRMAQIAAARAGRAPAAEPAPTILDKPEGVFRLARDGTLKQVMHPTTGEPMKGSSGLRVDASSRVLARQYYNDFERDPTVKRFKEMTPAAETLAPYMSSMSAPGAVSDNLQDLNLTKLYLGITRQKGENLTNMDKKGLAALAPLGTRIGQGLSGFFAGKDLSDEIRSDMWKTVVGNMAEMSKQHKKRMVEFGNRAEASGIPRNLVFDQEGQ